MSENTAQKSTEKSPYKKIEYDDDESVKTMKKICPAPIPREHCPVSRCTSLVEFGCLLCGRRFCAACIEVMSCMQAPTNDEEKKHVPLPICSDCNHTKTGDDHAHDDHEILAKSAE